MSELIQQATDAAANAYAPHSGIQVGCALETVAGNTFTGCNVENASYGLTICAERNAIFHGVAEEGPMMKIARLAVIALGHEFPPCGACRQVIAEFSLNDGATEIAWWKGGAPNVVKLRDLLPSVFSFQK